jgi:UDP-glucose 4-epimerase
MCIFENKTLLITGGTGSFGNAVLKKILKSEVEEIRIFSRDEEKQHQMRCNYSDKRIKYYIGDVRNKKSLDEVMKGVDLVFCAAALKQVPSCEFHPLEAIMTNTLGVANTLDSALQNRVQNVVVLSTDKAVYPINAMGMSKALAEKITVAKSQLLKEHSESVFCVTRYGNVMASRGSVIPLWVNQMKSGKPITVTDPLMTRFMMSLDEAVDLVFHAFDKGSSGDVFIKKAPSATMGQLARVLKGLFNSSSPIQTIGIRHGEKQHEVLMNKLERTRAEESEKYYKIPLDTRALNYDQYFIEGSDPSAVTKDYTSEYCYRLTEDELSHMLLQLDFIQGEMK